MAKILRDRSDYPHLMDIQIRWADYDALGHVNNVTYYVYIEAVITQFISVKAKLDWLNGPFIPYMAESGCQFIRALSFTETITGGFRVEHIGSKSAIYEIAIFGSESENAAALGRCVHVYVERESEKPVPIPQSIRAIYEKYLKNPEE